MGQAEVRFLRLPISVPCPVPVVPGTPKTLDDDGQPLPMDQRTEKCCVNAWWMMGRQPTCDVHVRQACNHLGIDFDGVVEEAGGPHAEENMPWLERYRYPQDKAF